MTKENLYLLMVISLVSNFVIYFYLGYLARKQMLKREKAAQKRLAIMMDHLYKIDVESGKLYRRNKELNDAMVSLPPWTTGLAKIVWDFEPGLVDTWDGKLEYWKNYADTLNEPEHGMMIGLYDLVIKKGPELCSDKTENPPSEDPKTLN